jgi:pseudouridine synthase
MDLVPSESRLFPVGRLDAETSGLLLLTNDGEWCNRLTHPKHQTPKTYVATVKGMPDSHSIKKLEEGVIIDGEKTAPCKAALVKSDETKSRIKIILREGRNRQVRKMCEAIGHQVINLRRTQVGALELGRLEKGKWRELSRKEVAGLLTPHRDTKRPQNRK